MATIIVEKDIRFYNWIIDVTCIAALTIVVYAISIQFIHSYFPPFQVLLFQGIYFLYYFTMEYSFNQTLGKMVTKTTVIHKSGRNPTLSNLIVRSLFRIATLDVLSFALGTKVGMHDLMSNTRVVKLTN